MDELWFFLLFGVLIIGSLVGGMLISESIQSDNLKVCVAAGKSYDAQSGDCN